MPLLAPCLVAFAVTLAPRAATSAEPTAAAVLPVEVHGTSDTNGELTRAIREAVGERLTLVPTARVAAAQNAEPDPACTTAACAHHLASALSARWLVRGRVTADGSDYSLEVRFTDGTTGNALPPAQAPCLACGWAEVGPRLAKLARQAADAATQSGNTGRTTAPSDTPPTTTTPSTSAGPGVGLTIGKWTAAGVAVGLLATSVAMFVFDGRGTCSLPADAGGLQCPQRYDTTVEGGVFLGVGLAAAAVAVTLFVLDRPPPAVAPSAMVLPESHGHGVVTTLGLSGSF